METKTLIETLVITIMASLLGLSMPLIMQIIEHLDAKYGDSVISTAFRKNWRYRYYFRMVWISIICVLWLPCAFEPIEYFRNNWFINNSAHILAWTSLAVTLFLLFLVFRRIMRYESPNDLLKLLAGVCTDSPGGSDGMISKLVSQETEFHQFGAVMKFSMKVGNTPLYLNCNMVLGSCIGECRKSAENGYPVVYPDPVYNLINESLRISQRFSDELLYPTLNNPQTFLSGYFDSYGNTTLSEVTFRQLWMNLGQLLKCDKPEWFKGYWAYVTQYADYTVFHRIATPHRLDAVERAEKAGKNLSDFPNDIIEEWNCIRAFRKEANSLRRFHHMLSAYMLFLGKNDLVKWTFVYTPSSLRTLFLIPRNISEIVKELTDIRDNPILFETNYSFFSEAGIESGDLMRRWLVRYYILALNEQSQMFTKAVTGYDPWNGEALYTNEDVNLAHRYIGAINELNGCLYPDCDYFDSLKISLDNLKDISGKLIALIDKLEKKRNDISARAHIDQDDLNRANRDLKEGKGYVLKNLNTTPPNSKGDISVLCETAQLSVPLSVSRKDFAYDKEKFCQKAVPGILSMMHRLLMLKYINIFRLSLSVKNINVDYSDISDALEKLQLRDEGEYVVIPIDVSLYTGDKRIFLEPLNGSGQSQIIIMRKTDLPSVGISDSESPVLSGKEEGDTIVLNTNFVATITVLPDFKFLRLIIVNSLSDGNKSELSSIKPVDTYFQQV